MCVLLFAVSNSKIRAREKIYKLLMLLLQICFSLHNWAFRSQNHHFRNLKNPIYFIKLPVDFYKMHYMETTCYKVLSLVFRLGPRWNLCVVFAWAKLCYTEVVKEVVWGAKQNLKNEAISSSKTKRTLKTCGLQMEQKVFLKYVLETEYEFSNS